MKGTKDSAYIWWAYKLKGMNGRFFSEMNSMAQYRIAIEG